MLAIFVFNVTSYLAVWPYNPRLRSDHCKMICRCEWADCQTSWLRDGKLFCQKNQSHTQVVHSREAWGFEWTYLIKCVLLRQIVTVTMCIIDKATAKHNTTTNRSMIHGACSGHQLEQGPRISHRSTLCTADLGAMRVGQVMLLNCT